jgi:hypothetical protein
MQELTKICKKNKVEIDDYLFDYYQHVNILLQYYDRKYKTFDKYFKLHYELMLHYKKIYKEMKFAFSLIKDWATTDFEKRINIYQMFQIHLNNITEIFTINMKDSIQKRNFELFKNYKLFLVAQIIPKSMFESQSVSNVKLILDNLYNKITITNMRNEQSIEIISHINQESELFTFSFVN